MAVVWELKHKTQAYYRLHKIWNYNRLSKDKIFKSPLALRLILRRDVSGHLSNPAFCVLMY